MMAESSPPAAGPSTSTSTSTSTPATSSTSFPSSSPHPVPRSKYKLVFLGDEAVGKTSIITRFMYDTFDNTYKVTIGIDFVSKTMYLEDRIVRLQLWDTAGQERFRTLTSAYYRGAHGIILVYDVTNRASFENIQHWLKEIDMYSTNDDAVKMLIGNKIDVGDSSDGGHTHTRQVTKQEGLAFARSNGMLFIESSAKTKVGIQQAFDELIQKILDVPSLLEGEDGASHGSTSQKDSVDIDRQEGNAGGGCCG